MSLSPRKIRSSVSHLLPFSREPVLGTRVSISAPPIRPWFNSHTSSWFQVPRIATPLTYQFQVPVTFIPNADLELTIRWQLVPWGFYSIPPMLSSTPTGISYLLQNIFLEICRRQPQDVNYNPRIIRCLWHRPFRAVLGPTVLPYGYPS